MAHRQPPSRSRKHNRTYLHRAKYSFALDNQKNAALIACFEEIKFGNLKQNSSCLRWPFFI